MQYSVLFLLLILTAQALFADTVAVKKHEQNVNKQYVQIVKKRYELQRKIDKAIGLYKEYSQKVHKQRKQLKEALKAVTYEDAVAAFQGDKKNISHELRPAYSIWRLLLPDEEQRLRLEDWVDNQMRTDLLGDFELKMKVVDNYRKIGNLLDDKDQREVDRLLATPISDWDDNKDNINYEQRAVESLKKGIQ